MTDEERYLLDTLERLRKSYNETTAPIIRRLAYLRSIGPIRIALDFDQANKPDFPPTEQDKI